MRILKTALASLLILCLITGCGRSLLLSGEIQVQTGQPITTEPTTSMTPEENAEDMRKSEEQKEIEKFLRMNGKRAFYLLPAGVPLPGGVTYFKVLDLIDDNTFLYAYQFLYKYGDKYPDGLGGVKEHGIKEKDETIGEFIMPFIPEDSSIVHPEGPASDAKNIVSVIMSYNFETKEYNVLFHDMQKVSAFYTVTRSKEKDGNEAKGSIELSFNAEEKAYGIGARLDLMPFLAAPMKDGGYAVYYRENVMFFDAKGQLTRVVDISKDLMFLLCKFAEKKDEKWSPDNLVTDEAGNFWITVKQSQEKELNENTPTEVDDKNSSARHYLMSFEKEMSSQGFHCNNTALDSQTKLFSTYNGQAVDFGDRDDKPTKEEILAVIGSEADVKKQIPNKYDNYYREGENEETFVALVRLRQDSEKEEKPQALTINITGDDLVKAEYPYYFSISEVGHLEDKKTKVDIWNAGCFGVLAEEPVPEPKTVKVPRTVTIEYSETHEISVTDEDGKEHTETVTEHYSFDYEDEGRFVEQLYVDLPLEENADKHWFHTSFQVGEIMRSPYDGVMRYNADKDTSDDPNTGKNYIRWDAPGSERLKFYQKEHFDGRGITMDKKLDSVELRTGAAGTTKSGFSDSILYLTNIDDLLIARNFNNDPESGSKQWAEQNAYEKRKIGFANVEDEKGMLTTKYYEGAFYLTNEQGKTFLYAANVPDGIVKYNPENTSDQFMNGQPVKGQIVTWPCLRILPLPGDKDHFLVLGFENGGAEGVDYTDADLPAARVYKISLRDKQASFQMLKTLLDRSEVFEYKSKLLSLSPGDENYNTQWNALFKAVGMDAGSGVSEDVRKYCQKALITRWSGGMAFLRLSGLSNNPNMKAILEELDTCSKQDEVESIIVKYTDIHVKEEEEPVPTDGVAYNAYRVRIRNAKLEVLKKRATPVYTDETWAEAIKKIINTIHDFDK